MARLCACEPSVGDSVRPARLRLRLAAGVAAARCPSVGMVLVGLAETAAGLVLQQRQVQPPHLLAEECPGATELQGRRRLHSSAAAVAVVVLRRRRARQEALRFGAVGAVAQEAVLDLRTVVRAVRVARTLQPNLAAEAAVVRAVLLRMRLRIPAPALAVVATAAAAAAAQTMLGVARALTVLLLAAVAGVAVEEHLLAVPAGRAHVVR